MCKKSGGRTKILLNGFFRFPLVLLYCLVGVGIGSFAKINEDFVNQLSMDGLEPNFNLAVPIFLLQIYRGSSWNLHSCIICCCNVIN